MKLKQIVQSGALVVAFGSAVAGISLALPPTAAMACVGSSCGGGTGSGSKNNQPSPTNGSNATDCPKTSIIKIKCTKITTSAQQSPIWTLLIMVLNIMTAGVGIAAVGGIVYGSMLYASAGDKAEQTKKAVSVITNVAIGIVAYGFMYLLLNFLIPGGIFN